jgi:hypothetical protein
MHSESLHLFIILSQAMPNTTEQWQWVSMINYRNKSTFECGNETPRLLRNLRFDRILRGTYLYKEQEMKTRIFKYSSSIQYLSDKVCLVE